jgi:hypothetical protein
MKKIFLFLFIIFISCTKDDSAVVAVKSVYLLHNEQNIPEPNTISLIKDGKIVLTIDNAIAKAMAIDKNNSYIIGLQDSKAELWKNGVATELTDFYEAVSISVVGNDVYVLGFGIDKNSDRIVLLWKNGITTALDFPDFKYGYIKNGCLSGDKVHVYGNNNMGDFIYSAYGKESKLIRKNSTYPIELRSIFVVNEDVYIAGNEANDNQVLTAEYWKNGVETILGNGNYQSLAQSIFVSGNDVYAVGYEYNSDSKKIARLWKNGIGTNLTENLSDANLVFVAENDVYVAGRENGISRLWKNGIAVELPVKSGEFISVIAH